MATDIPPGLDPDAQELAQLANITGSRRCVAKGCRPPTWGPLGQIDGAVLLADGSEKLPHHVSDRRVQVPERPLVASRRPPSVERNVRINGPTHLHFFVRVPAGDGDWYCAVVQDSPVHANGAVTGAIIRQAKLAVVEPETPNMDKSVLVLIPEVIQRLDFRAIEPAPLWIGLQRLDECPWPRADAADLVHAAVRRPTGVVPRCDLGGLSKSLLLRADGEGGSVQLTPLSVDGEPVDTLIQCRPEVMKGFSQDDGPLNGDGIDKPKPEEVFASLVVYFWRKTPWPVFSPCKGVIGQHLVVEDAKVIFCSPDLDLNRLKGSLIDFHDLLLEPDPKKNGARPMQDTMQRSQGRAGRDLKSHT